MTTAVMFSAVSNWHCIISWKELSVHFASC